MREEWENAQFSANKSPYLTNGAIYALVHRAAKTKSNAILP